MLKPFVATPDDPWDAARAAHLARRAGFGATPDEVTRLVALGPEGAVAHFVDFVHVDESLEDMLGALRIVPMTQRRPARPRPRRGPNHATYHGG